MINFQNMAKEENTAWLTIIFSLIYVIEAILLSLSNSRSYSYNCSNMISWLLLYKRDAFVPPSSLRWSTINHNNLSTNLLFVKTIMFDSLKSGFRYIFNKAESTSIYFWKLEMLLFKLRKKLKYCLEKMFVEWIFQLNLS